MGDETPLTSTGRQYFIEDRTGEYRAVDDPHDRLPMDHTTVTVGAWHAWVERGQVVPAFLPPHRNDAVTISVPGTSREVITAAS